MKNKKVHINKESITNQGTDAEASPQNSLNSGDENLFLEGLRSSLYSHTLDPGPDQWDKIQSALTNPDNSRIPTTSANTALAQDNAQTKVSIFRSPYFWAAAASVLLIFGTFITTEDKRLNENSNRPEIYSHLEKKLPAHPESEALTVQTHSVRENSLFAGKNSSDKNSVSTDDNSDTESNTMTVNPTDGNSLPAGDIADQLAMTTPVEKRTSKDPLFPETTEDPTITSPEERSILRDQLLPESSEDWTKPSQEQESWTMLASVGTQYSSIGGGPGELASSLSGRDMLYLSESLSNDVIYSYIPKPEEFKNRKYTMPIATGVQVSGTLNEEFALSAGISYTQLMTYFSEYTYGNYDASLKLHYLGLPVDLHYRMKDQGKWNYGFLAGVMVEKGLQSDYLQHQDFISSLYTTRIKQKIEGLQWSAHLGFELNYRIEKHWLIYMSARMSYFMDNAQPFSIRSEEPLQPTLHAGLRYSFR